MQTWILTGMAKKNRLLRFGDSHEYGLNPEPFDRVELNQYILDYFKHFAQPPSLQIAQTWHGLYAKIPYQTELVVYPEPGVTIVNAPGGAGMTLSFGLAEKVVNQVGNQTIKVVPPAPATELGRAGLKT